MVIIIAIMLRRVRLAGLLLRHVRQPVLQLVQQVVLLLRRVHQAVVLLRHGNPINSRQTVNQTRLYQTDNPVRPHQTHMAGGAAEGVAATVEVTVEAAVAEAPAVLVEAVAVEVAAEAEVAAEDDNNYVIPIHSIGISETLISLRQKYLPSFFTNRLI